MTRIYFVASRPDIVKALWEQLFFDREDAEKFAIRWNKSYQENYWKVFSALVEVEK